MLSKEKHLTMPRFSGGEKQPNVPSRDSMYTKARFLEPKMPKRVTTKFTTALGSGTFEYHCRAAG